MDWHKISAEPTLSMEFIEEHKHVIDWFSIFLERNLPLDFFKAYISYISYENCSKNTYLNQEQVSILRDYYIRYWKQYIDCTLTSHEVDDEGFTKVSFIVKLHASRFPKAKHVSYFLLDVTTLGPTYDFSLTAQSIVPLTITKDVDLFEMCSSDTQFETILHIMNEELIKKNVFQEPIFFNVSSSGGVSAFPGR